MADPSPTDSTPDRAARRRSAQATIQDVARAAGVAASTVSRALNDNTSVAPQTRARIRAIAERLGYRPSRSARSLRSARTFTLGLLAPDLTNAVAHAHLRGAVREASDLGYTVFVCDAQGSPEMQSAQLTRLLELRVDGILLGRGVLYHTDEIDEVMRSGVPTEPSLQRLAEVAEGSTTFTPYPERARLERGAALAALRHLLRLGHRRFAYVHLDRDLTYMGELRYHTFAAALAEADVDEQAITRLRARTREDAAAQVQWMAGMEDRPTALVCANGLLTPGVLHGVNVSGLRIPDDMSVVTYGDSDWHECYNPPISVIRHDYVAAGVRGVRRLVARIENQPDPDLPRQPSEFVNRASTAPPLVRA